MYELRKPPYGDMPESRTKIVEKDESGKRIARKVVKAAYKAAAKQHSEKSCTFDVSSQGWQRLPMVDFSELSTAGVTWRIGLYGPEHHPIKSLGCEDSRLRNLVYKGLVPELLKHVARGDLFETLFPAPADDNEEAPLTVFSPSIDSAGQSIMALDPLHSPLRICSVLTMRNKYYIMERGGAGRVYFSPAPGMRVLIGEVLAPIRTWTTNPYCSHDLKAYISEKDLTKFEMPKWEARQDYDIRRPVRMWQANRA